MCTDKLHKFFSSPNTIRVIKSRRVRWTGHVAFMGKKRDAFRSLTGRAGGKWPLGRPRNRRKDNMQMKRKEIEW